VLITEKMQPKLCNFKFSREFNATNSPIDDMKDIIHWLAPEKLEHISPVKGSKANKACSYTIQCDIFRSVERFHFNFFFNFVFLKKEKKNFFSILTFFHLK
jgi:hypothetical protein